MLFRHYLEQGTSKSALARTLGVHRDTIHRWIRDGELDRDLDGEPVRYGPRRPVPTKLDAYKAIIETRLAAYPALSAVRLLAEIRAAGFEGSYTQLKAFVRHVRPTPPPEPVIRFETPAGRQAQVDFAEFRFPWGKRYAFAVEAAKRVDAVLFDGAYDPGAEGASHQAVETGLRNARGAAMKGALVMPNMMVRVGNKGFAAVSPNAKRASILIGRAQSRVNNAAKEAIEARSSAGAATIPVYSVTVDENGQLHIDIERYVTEREYNQMINPQPTVRVPQRR